MIDEDWRCLYQTNYDFMAFNKLLTRIYLEWIFFLEITVFINEFVVALNRKDHKNLISIKISSNASAFTPCFEFV